jgi:ATP adenylyltransferase
MQYLLGGEAPSAECIFCAFPAAGPETRREHLILACSRRAFVIMNRFPYNNGHIMVVPRMHVAEPGELPDGELAALNDWLVRATRAIRQTLRPDGINVGMNLGKVAGAGIAAHCHWHIVPRWNGDTNFMPVLADVRVMSEHLVEGWERLRPAFETVEREAGDAG